MQVRWHGKQEAIQGDLDCAQLKARQASLVDYDLDYDHGLFGDIPDPCSEDAIENVVDAEADEAPAVAEVAKTEPPEKSQQQAAQVPVAEAAEAFAKTGSGSAAGGLSVKARVAEAMAARGATTGGAQQGAAAGAGLARSSVGKVLLGSTTQWILLDVPVPILLVTVP